MLPTPPLRQAGAHLTDRDLPSLWLLQVERRAQDGDPAPQHVCYFLEAPTLVLPHGDYGELRED